MMQFDEAGIEIGGPELGHGDQPAEKVEIRLRPQDLVLPQRLLHARQRGCAILAAHDQLGNHRVVVNADGVAAAYAGIDTHVIA